MELERLCYILNIVLGMVDSGEKWVVVSVVLSFEFCMLILIVIVFWDG